MSAAITSCGAAPVILTGDRPTGPLHLGHFVGSLRNRVRYQDTCRQYIMIADAQALTDNMDDTRKVNLNVIEMALDYLAVGIDPKKSTIFIQSQVPELAELAFYYLNLVSVARLERNPTVKEEIRQRGFERDIPAGFLTYPASQAADITAFKASLVPVGEDQIPMIEQSNEIVRRFNRITGRDILVEAKALVPEMGRLPGIDGKAKMSKSLRNMIHLHASPDEIRAAVKQIYTDPLHLRIEDPGHLEGNVAFIYLDAFDPDVAGLAELKAQYVRGGLADSIVKARLEACLQEALAPIRTRRQQFEKARGDVLQLLQEGTAQARETAAQTIAEVKAALGLRYF
ncbi:Tryptophanyl-tRNA synthetase (Tryptophan--tRNA ligase) (TrpRS) [Candidatus Glomeribacter gigasporarum BEG34]|uniref:Tryptophan--tRNA ligase n=1 Tax=Candidatus Glomeribacter gigasporarum BEG34 TaxID=1070319 RepID=G2J762_9BURK|nr:tryptophan--tRNA ligase [Candidatus Glomeribacter gigasporarum]CCD28602.1 Tryptophanyl-tRNA synthetase (Tryptophan--tRNA ligase) (TrpRS) [Candidatus Glomeribacter gigasporarum BEG34]